MGETWCVHRTFCRTWRANRHWPSVYRICRDPRFMAERMPGHARGSSISAMSFMDDWSPQERDHHRQFMARLEAVVEERLADYRRRDVYVFDMVIHPDDDSDEAPNLWMACDHYTGDEIQTVAAEDLLAFYAEHPDWVEYTGLLDEVQEELSSE
jgi:hypothetical protein